MERAVEQEKAIRDKQVKRAGGMRQVEVGAEHDAEAEHGDGHEHDLPPRDDELRAGRDVGFDGLGDAFDDHVGAFL